MLYESAYYCPECDEGIDVPASASRRDFLRTVGSAAALALVGGSGPRAADPPTPPSQGATKPAETLIRELFQTLSDDQKKQLVYPWNHAAGASGKPARMLTPNGPIFGKRIAENYTKPQQELLQRILRAVLASDEAYERISRNNKWDNSGSFAGCGTVLFGEPKDGAKFAWVFSGHHLTVRCDGNSEPGAAFGGPIYYGHIANGYSPNNVWFFQTKRVQAVYDALSEKQRQKAVPAGRGVDREPSLQPRDPRHGISYGELSQGQRQLVEQVMRDLLTPFRQQDGDEVMQLIKANGGLEKIHLAFYGGGAAPDNPRWDCWRLEGPGFIWNYRVLPHVHCYVNIASKA